LDIVVLVDAHQDRLCYDAREEGRGQNESL
jgi:hypothetical protein